MLREGPSVWPSLGFTPESSQVTELVIAGVITLSSLNAMSKHTVLSCLPLLLTYPLDLVLCISQNSAVLSVSLAFHG